MMIFRCLMGVSVLSSNQTDFVHEKRSKRALKTGDRKAHLATQHTSKRPLRPKRFEWPQK